MLQCSLIEGLESRRLLAITFVDGVINVVGTNGNDEIKFDFEDGGIRARLNREEMTFNISEVTGIRAEGGAGNDRLRSDDDNPMTVPMTLLGGLGNDRLVGGLGADLLD